jgi:hypothetical protein
MGGLASLHKKGINRGKQKATPSRKGEAEFWRSHRKLMGRGFVTADAGHSLPSASLA